jgi:tetratricopeptide (TPR) repeat protein
LRTQVLDRYNRYYLMGSRSGAIQSKEIQWSEIVSQLETMVIAGQHQKCRDILEHYNPRKIPRNYVLSISQIAWRTNSYLFALKALRHLIYPINPLTTVASPQEKIIYATSLASLGATGEAIQILSKVVESNSEPSALFHLASTHMFNWNYQAAIPYLKKYILEEKTTPYQRLVGKINWAAALIHLEDWVDARKILDEVQAACEVETYGLLLGNCWELRAQIEIFQQNYSVALDHLQKSLSYLKNQSGNYLLYAEKWIAICNCLNASNENSKNDSIANLDQIRKKAVNAKHWNTLRECDLFEALVLKDEYLFRKVLIGTPSEMYRKRVRKIFKSNAISIGHYSLYIRTAYSQVPNSRVEFDPHKELFKKPSLYALFEALCQDFYQPQTIGMLFQKVYFKEKFNPFTSPARVLQLLRRLNLWFEKKRVSLAVDFVKSEFQLTSPEGIYILLSRGYKKNATEVQISIIKKEFNGRSFSIQEACQALGVSKATAERILKMAFEIGYVQKERKRVGVAYRFANSKPKRKTA